MQLHQIVPRHKFKKRKRVGRGGKRGTYAGRGLKGQKARAGTQMKPAIRDWLKRYPKLRGYRFLARPPKPYFAINLDVLEKKFQAGEEVSPKTLLERGLVAKKGGKPPLIKILGRGDLTKKLIIRSCMLSKQASQKLQAVGCLFENCPKKT